MLYDKCDFTTQPNFNETEPGELLVQENKAVFSHGFIG